MSDREILKVINNFALRLISIPTHQDLVWHVAREVVGRLGFDDCVVYLFDPEKNILRQSAAIGEDKNPSSNEIRNPLEIPVGQGITGHVAQTRTPLIIDDLMNDERYIPDINTARSEICVPMLADGYFFGVIDSEAPDPNHFTSDHLEILMTVAAMASAKLRLLDQDKTLEMTEKLLEAETRFRDFAEAASDWFWEFDENLRYSLLSPSPGVDSHYPIADFIGKSRQDVKPEEISEELWRSHMATLEAHQPFRGFIQPRKLEDGRTLWFSINGKPVFDPNGQFKGYRGTASNITARMEAESETLKALTAAETANQAKSDFLATISHELRTPLTSIKGAIGLLVGLRGDDFSDDSRSLLDMALHNCDTLVRLVNEFLDYEKIIAGKMTFNFSTHDIAQLTQNIVDTNLGLAQAHSVRFTFHNPDRPAHADIDKTRFNQILHNLLSNAAKFSPANGNIDIRVEVLGDRVRTSVKDSGVGIADSHKQVIFDRFTQIDSSDSRQQGGTGLGLAISKALAESMNGALGVESAVGQGAMFYLDLPKLENPAS